MSFLLKLSAYAFLSLMGLSAWRAGVEGWRYYFGIVLFIVCTLRILMMLRQRMSQRSKSKSIDTQPPQATEATPTKQGQNSPEQ